MTVYIGLPWYGPLLAFLFGIALSRVARILAPVVQLVSLPDQA